MKRFFWFCSGADISLLEREECSTERNKYAGIGSTILLTALLASVSGGYAVYTVFRHYPQSIAFGILWALLIFNLDRYIVLSMRAESHRPKRQLWTAAPRILLALLISIVVTVPLELKIFDKEIENQLEKIHTRESVQNRSEVNLLFTEITRRKEEIAQLKKEIDDKEQYKDGLFREARDEAEGRGGTMHAGEGPVYAQKIGRYDKANEDFENAKKINNAAIAEKTGQIKTLEMEQDALVKEKDKRTNETNGLLARLTAMHDLISESKLTFIAFWLLAALFFVVETAPVVVKLFSRRGPYDALLEAKETEIISTEERRTSDARGKADSEAEYKKQIDAAFRNTEFDRVKQVLQGISSHPDWGPGKSALEDALVRRLGERSSKMVSEILPGESNWREAAVREETKERPSDTVWWRSWQAVTIVILAICVGVLLLLWRSALITSNSYGGYIWRDPSSSSAYLAVVSKTPVDPSIFKPNDVDVDFIPADLPVPISTPGGFQSSTYQMLRRVKSESHLVDGDTQPTVYFVGETHFGKSQLEVAKILCDLIRQHEIDAIFLEQPDDRAFDWSKFQNLQNNPEEAIAALQYHLIKDANQFPEVQLGEFDEFYKEFRRKVDLSTKDGQQRLQEAVSNRFDPEKRERFYKALKSESQRIHDSPNNWAYEHAEYISAADYLYVMTSLKGMTIPFQPVDSPALRAQYLVDNGLEARDHYTAQKISTMISANGYHQVIYIGGASHLSSLSHLLRENGLQVNVAFSAFAGVIKQGMATLLNSDYVVNLATQETPPEFSFSVSYVLANNPSDDLINKFESSLKDGDRAFGDHEIAGLRQQFIQTYSSLQLRGKTKWNFSIVTDDGKKALVISWDARNSDLVITSERAPADEDLRKFAANPVVHQIDYTDSVRLAEINRDAEDFILATVKKNLSVYQLTIGEHAIVGEVTGAGSLPTPDLTAAQVVKVINEMMRQSPKKVIYLDLKDFSNNDDIKAFSSSCGMQQRQINPSVALVTFARHPTQDTFFSAKLLFRGAEPRIETITEGEYKGWFQITLKFLSNVSGQLVGRTVGIILKSYDVAAQFLAKITLMSSSVGNQPIQMSPAQIISACIRQLSLSKRTGQEIFIKIEDEIGKMDVAKLLIRGHAAWS